MFVTTFSFPLDYPPSDKVFAFGLVDVSGVFFDVQDFVVGLWFFFLSRSSD